MTADDVADILSLLAELPLVNKPREITPHTAEAYLLMLRDLSADDVRASAQRHCATSVYWPTVKDLRDGVVRTRLAIPSAEDVLEEVLRAIHDRGYTTPPKPSDLSSVASAVVQTMGWQTICASENPEALRAHILRLAQTFADRAVTAGNLSAMGMRQAHPDGPAERALPATMGDIVRGVLPSLGAPPRPRLRAGIDPETLRHDPLAGPGRAA